MPLLPATRIFQASPQAPHPGVVLLDVTITTAGQPTDLTVKKTPGYGLEDQALQILPKWKLKPCTKDNHPVNCRITIEVNFDFQRH